MPLFEIAGTKPSLFSLQMHLIIHLFTPRLRLWQRGKKMPALTITSHHAFKTLYDSQCDFFLSCGSPGKPDIFDVQHCSKLFQVDKVGNSQKISTQREIHHSFYLAL